MYQENLNTSQKRLLSLSIAYKNKQRIKDESGNEVMMFFNEDFLTEIIKLMSAFTHSKYSKVKDIVKKETRIFSIKKHLDFISEKYKFNCIDFIEYGQRRGKDWQQMDYKEYIELVPKEEKKQKFINPKNRRRYVI